MLNDPAPLSIKLIKKTKNKSGFSDPAKPSRARCPEKATSMVKAKKEALILVYNPTKIKIPPRVSAIIAMNPKKTLTPSIPSEPLRELPSLCHLSGPPISFGIPCKYTIKKPKTTRVSNNALFIFSVFKLKRFG